jgi:hypothetical protein
MFSAQQGRVLKGAGWLAAALFAMDSAVAQAPEGLNGPEYQTAHHGQQRFLQGDYGFTTSNSCVRALPHPPSIVGIDPDTRQLLVPGEAVSQSGLGVMHFFRDGRMRLEATASEVNFNANQAGMTPSTTGLDGTCTGTYTLGRGNKLTVFFNCHVDIPQQGVSFDLGPVESEGFVNEDGRTINLNQKDNIQTVTLFLPNGNQLVSERVCTQRFALTKLNTRFNPRER